MNLHDIAIRVADDARTGQSRAVQSEIANLIEALLADGKGGAIDLRGLPLTPGDLVALEEWLGRGEVYAEIEAGGVSRIYETSYPGVWRVTHYSDDEQVIADTIEVGWVPEILRAHRDDIAHGAQRLRVAIGADSGS